VSGWGCARGRDRSAAGSGVVRLGVARFAWGFALAALRWLAWWLCAGLPGGFALACLVLTGRWEAAGGERERCGVGGAAVTLGTVKRVARRATSRVGMAGIMIVDLYLVHNEVEVHDNSRGMRVGLLRLLGLAGLAIGEACGAGVPGWSSCRSRL
jgi:hypothetical protein